MAKYSLTLELPEQAAEDLARKAAREGLTVPEILQAFINDLVDGEECGGSDEYEKANAWYSRRGFFYMGEGGTMLAYFGDNTRNLEAIAEAASEGDSEALQEFYDDYKDAARGKPEQLQEAVKRVCEFVATMPKEEG